MFGAGGGTSSYEEVEHTDLVLLWGSNARAAHPIFFHHVLKGIHEGARLVVIDPRRTESAEWGDLWLGIDVGSDIGLSNAIAREIIANDLQHHSFIAQATLGFDEYRDSVMDWTLERGEQVTGVPAEVIREDGALRVATWDEALDRAAQGLRRATERNSGNGVGLFSCSKATNEMNFVAQKFARQVLHSNNIDSCNRT